MNPDAFSASKSCGEEAVKERLVEHEATLRKQDPQSAEGARRQDPQNQQGLQDMPGSCSDVHPHELEPTADASLNSNAEGKRQAQPRPKMLNFGN